MTLLLACAEPEQAPRSYEDLVLAMYRDQDDAEALAVDAGEFVTWLEESFDPESEGYRIRTLTEDDLDGLPHPGDLADARGGAAGAVSPHTLTQHVEFAMLPDQRVIDESDYDLFDRTFLEGGDCFPDTCDALRTWNNIIKNGAFNVKIPYAYEKDYRRVVTTRGDEVIIARGWVEEAAYDEAGDNGILQSYNLDVFVPWQGGVLRTQAQWMELLLVIDDLVTEDFLYDQLLTGIFDVFEDTDAAIDEQGL